LFAVIGNLGSSAILFYLIYWHGILVDGGAQGIFLLVLVCLSVPCAFLTAYLAVKFCKKFSRTQELP